MERGLSEAPVAVAPAPAAQLEATSGTPRRIGLLGGTFDPPHLGHLVLGMMAGEALALDRVLFIPAAVPPHKRERVVSSATDRLLLTRLAIAGDPLFDLSAIEIERGGVSYTVDTLAELARVYGADATLYLILAADTFTQIAAWREPDRLLDLAHWVIGPRPGWQLPTRAELTDRFGDRHDRIHVVDGPAIAISSSELRRRIAEGRSIRYLVPRAVEDQIATRGLYRR